MSWSTEQTNETVATIRIKAEFNQQWEQWVLASSDRHFDNPKSNIVMQKRHLDMAKERDAFVIDCGDCFCAMQGKFDPRSRKGDTKPENEKEDYLDTLVDSSEKLFGPYASLFAVIGTGNHESGILKRLGTDLTGRFVKRLNNLGSKALQGGYRGWIKLLFSSSGKDSYNQSFNIYYNHGSNSNAPVTKGILKTSRRGLVFPDADILLTGHIHEAWAFPIYRSRLSNFGAEYTDKQMHIQLPTYKEEFQNEVGGYHHENERPPKPIGAWWLRFFYERATKKIKFEATQAE